MAFRNAMVFSMAIMPSIRVIEQQRIFETHLNRFIQRDFPGLKLSMKKDLEAQRFELTYEKTLIVEIDTLPVSNELEIQLARPCSDDMGFCEAFYSWIGKTYGAKARLASDVHRATWPVPLVINQQLFQHYANEHSDNPEVEELKCKFLDIARRRLPPVISKGSNQDPMEDARLEIQNFKSLFERQLRQDIFVNSKPQENIARALLQAFLPERSYREIPVRGGKSDLLVFAKQGGRFLYETKIWRGGDYYKQGLREIEEYIIGEDDDQKLLGIFYLVFDSTKTKRAQVYRGSDSSTKVVCGRSVEVVIINVSLSQPSKKF